MSFDDGPSLVLVRHVEPLRFTHSPSHRSSSAFQDDDSPLILDDSPTPDLPDLQLPQSVVEEELDVRESPRKRVRWKERLTDVREFEQTSSSPHSPLASSSSSSSSSANSNSSSFRFPLPESSSTTSIPLIPSTITNTISSLLNHDRRKSNDVSHPQEAGSVTNNDNNNNNNNAVSVKNWLLVATLAATTFPFAYQRVPVVRGILERLRRVRGQGFRVRLKQVAGRLGARVSVMLGQAIGLR
jgi:hypothetical protein